LIAVAILLRLLQFVLSVGGAALSRHNERQADAFAASTTDGGAALADGLARLSKDSLSNLTPHPFYVTLNYSHPPVLERLRSLRGATSSRSDRPGSGIPGPAGAAGSEIAPGGPASFRSE
jgi:STE24 endopeptidase